MGKAVLLSNLGPLRNEKSSSDQIIQQSKVFRSDRPASKVLQVSNVLQIRSSSEQGSTGEQGSSDQIAQQSTFFRSDRPAVNVLQIRVFVDAGRRCLMTNLLFEVS